MAASRSLGTLTVDLVAKISGFVQGMDEAERKADRATREMQKKAKARAEEIDKAFTAIGIGAAAGMAALGLAVSKVVDNAANLANIASISNTTTQEFQKLAVAASSVGINQEKLGDQLKDFTEKVGEFQATGGGGMKDFFEQIAPKIGITADAFKNLSGPQALQLYYDSLEKAGIGQDRMSFYLESMASDTTALIPILANGGEMIREMGDAAEKAGVIMSDKTVRAAQEMKVQIQMLQMQTEGLVTQLVSAMLPTLADLAGEFSEVTVEGSTATSTGEAFSSVFRTVAAVAAGAYGSIRLLGKSLGGLGAIAGAGGGLESLTDFANPGKMIQNFKSSFAGMGGIAKIVGDDLDAEAQRMGEVVRNIWNAGTGESERSQWAKRMVDMRAAAEQASRARTGSGSAPEDKAKKEAADKEREAAIRYLSALKDLAEGRKSMTQTEQIAYDLANKRIKLTDKEIEQAYSRAAVIDMIADGEERAKEMIRQREELTRDAASITEQMMTPTEKWVKQVEKLNELSAAGVLSQDTYARAVKVYYKDLTDATDNFALKFQENVQSMIGDSLVNGLQGSFKDIAASFLKMLLQMEAQAAAANFMRMLTGEGEAKSSPLSGLLGKASSWIGGLFAGGRANGGPVSSNTLYRVNENGPELLTVGGKDYLMMGAGAGYVTPNAANLDATAKTGGGNVTIVNQTTGRIDQVEERRISAEDRVLIIKESVAAVRSEMQNANSATSRTMAANFQLNRRRS